MSDTYEIYTPDGGILNVEKQINLLSDGGGAKILKFSDERGIKD
ncbi:hypothetical protein OLQ22_04745 [Campylobacter jejuni]|nr:hypothetical protein [Campylobacter jejuni]